jgi:hypothetical protein
MPPASSGELVLVLFHPDARSPERDAFGFQAHSLFQAMLAGEGDFPASGDHTVPWKPGRRGA